MGGWRKAALCARPGIDRDCFYPEKGRSAAKARRICRFCPVRSPCLEEALVLPLADDAYGVRGGLTPPEWRALRAERRVVS